MMLLWHVASVASGASAGLLGTYLVGFRMPFLAIAMAHAAMLGAVVAQLVGWPAQPVALGTALVAAAGVAWCSSRRTRTDLNTLTSMLLSLTMGLTFLGMYMNDGDMSPMLTLLWGNLLFITQSDAVVMSTLLGLLGLYVVLFRKELDALLFSRAVAKASGIADGPVLLLFLVLAAGIITVNLEIVGGLLMYSLLTNPAAAAYEVGASMRQVRWLAIAFGVISTLGGLWFSYTLDLPTGACIVLVSSAVYGLCLLATRFSRTVGAR